MTGKKNTKTAKRTYTLYIREDHFAILQRMSEGTGGEQSVAFFVRKAIQEFVGKKKRR